MKRGNFTIFLKIKEYTWYLLMQVNLFIQGMYLDLQLYSYGDIYQLSPIIATLYAILSKVHTFEFLPYENPLSLLP